MVTTYAFNVTYQIHAIKLTLLIHSFNFKNQKQHNLIVNKLLTINDS